MKLEAYRKVKKGYQATTVLLPQDEEGDVFSDKGDRHAWYQSNQVWRKDCRYSALVVAIKEKTMIMV